MKKYTIVLFSLLLSLSLTAQKQASFWFFGEKAGLDFNSGAPVALTNGELSTWEGCSSISTETGILRFYTDGSTIWNKNDLPMPNGSGLMGNTSSTQSGIIVPWPENDKKYFVFTIDDVDAGGGANGLRYSVVDMALAGFLGDVVANQKNILLTAPMCEKLTAVGHDNGIDTWVIAQKWGTNDFYAYRVTPTGVVMTPVISSVGTVIDTEIDNAKGYMKVSPNGEKLAKANAGLKNIEIFDFDNATGIISNVITDYSLGGEPYGIEFSPNSKLLYVNTWKANSGQKLLQYNLEAGTPGEILDSQVQIASGTNGALQIAPDNKLYVSMNLSGSISVVNVPNKLGSACLYEANKVYLDGKIARYGLPPFVQSFFSFNPGFYNETPCYTDSTQFYENSSVTPDSVWWDFGNLASGEDNYSTEFDPVHLFTAPGLYFVKHVIWVEGLIDSITNGVFVHQKPDIQLGSDTSFCEGDPLLLDAGEGFDSYLWSNGDTTMTTTVYLAGDYSCYVTNGPGCGNSDTVAVVALPKPVIDLGNDVALCAGGFYTIDAGPGYTSYLWPNGSTQQTYSVETSGTYWVEVTNDVGCAARDSLTVTFYPNPVADAGPVQTIDQGQTTVLDGSATGGLSPYFYEWQPANLLVQNDIAAPATLPIITPSWFTLTVTDSRNCVSESSEVLINLTGSSLMALPTADPDTICLGESTDISAYATGGGLEYTYAWTGDDPPGFTSSQANFTVTPTTTGTILYKLYLTDQYNNEFNGSAKLVVKPLPVIDLVPDGIVPVGPDTIVVCVRDTVMLDAGHDDDPGGTTYFWTQSNYLNRYFTASTNGNWIDFQTHEVRVNYPGSSGCESIGNITIVFDFNECQIGIDESTDAEEMAFQLFPNPNNGTFTLLLNTEMRDMGVRVYNSLGKPVYNEHFSGSFQKGYRKQVQLNVHQKGIYFVKVFSAESGLLSVQKILVK
ncbi:MAG: T9SS type A sorting domain-containing protein [Bacteroidales bacterium]|nr:T9SS type A sorting domain-containing protein [Bacteroidales bacterium]